MSTHTPYGEPRSPSSRFLPPDPGVEAPYRLTPGLAFRVGVLGIVALAVFAVLFFRLWSLQVLSGDTYLAAAQGNQLRTIRLEAPRGTIVDRNGRVIVDNVAGTAVKLWVGDLPRNRRYAVIKHLADGARRAAGPLAKEVDERIADPLNPITVKTARAGGPGRLPLRAPGGVPGRPDPADLPAPLPATSRSRRRCSATSARSRRASSTGKPQTATAPGDKVGKTGVEARDDEYLRGDAGQARDPRRLDGPPAGRRSSCGARRGRARRCG